MNASNASAVRGPASLLVACMLLGTADIAVHGQAQSPVQFIATTAATLADAVATGGEALKHDAGLRQALVTDILLPRFDLETSSRLILRSHWKTAPEAERRRFVEAFYGFLVATYAKALPGFRHDTVTLLPEQEAAFGSRSRVRAGLKLNDGSRFQIDFYLRHDGRDWRIVDILVEGVSYVRNYRSDFGAEIRATGLAGLIAWLDRRGQ